MQLAVKASFWDGIFEFIKRRYSYEVASDSDEQRDSRETIHHVFLNVPYEQAYEPLLLAFTVALIALGRIPRLTLEIPDTGSGRMKRIFSLIKSCPVSFHDLSGPENRHNMPFELGLACAAHELGTDRRKHCFHVFESVRYSCKKTLSDLAGIDPKSHENDPVKVVNATLALLGIPDGGPTTRQVLDLLEVAKTSWETLKIEFHDDHLFSAVVYPRLVAVIWKQAVSRGYHG
jgi:hypothetical protein